MLAYQLFNITGSAQSVVVVRKYILDAAQTQYAYKQCKQLSVMVEEC